MSEDAVDREFPPLSTPYAALVAYGDRSAPFLTWYDDRDAIRIEVSLTSLANAIAKAAGLLRDEYDVQPGDHVGIDIPPHWQAAVWLGACWSVRAVACLGSSAGDAQIVVSHRADVHAAGAEVIEVDLSPLWLPARGMPDTFTPVSPQQPDDPALIAAGAGQVLSAGDVMNAARARASHEGLRRGARVLVAATSESLDLDLAMHALPVPLITGGSVVLVSHQDEDPAQQSARASAERITASVVPP